MPHGTSLEDYVAYQWEQPPDLLGYRSGKHRDRIVLQWMADALKQAAKPAAALDVGCSYGHHLFMLDAMLDKPTDVSLVGVDLFDGAVAYANEFAQRMPGFQNCRFQVADIEAGLPFDSATFDAVSMCDVLEHLTDPAAALRELMRVAKPGGTIVMYTPLRDSLFKRMASLANKASGNRLGRAYYEGKDSELDEAGNPIMFTPAGHDHISEMSYKELVRLVKSVGLKVAKVELMQVMSGSNLFDRHPFLLSSLMFLEAVHETLHIPGWAHRAILRLTTPNA